MIFPFILLLNNAHALSFDWLRGKKSPSAPGAPVNATAPGNTSNPKVINPVTENFSNDNVDAVTLGKKLDLKGWEPKKEITKNLGNEVLDVKNLDREKFKAGVDKVEEEAKKGKL